MKIKVLVISSFVILTTSACQKDPSPMKIKDIPGPADKLIFEKVVPHYPSPLKVGFEYSIENVGRSHFTDSFGVNEKYTVVDFNFK